MKNDLISICIASYNVESYILQCLDSIKNIEQDISKEIIIVDDCSNDNTIRLIQKWIKENPEISTILFINPTNIWPWGSYNKASYLSTGKYITFLDSDDFLITPSFKEKLSYFKENKNLKVVYWNGLFFEKEELGISFQDNLNDKLYGTVEEIRKTLYITIPMLSISTSLIKKDFFDLIGGFDKDIWSNDWILNIKIRNTITNKNEIKFYEIPCFAYRMHDSNISKDQEKMITLLTQVVERYHPEKYKNIAYSNIYFFSSLNAILQKNYKISYQYITQSLSYKPDIKRILIYILSLCMPHIIFNKFSPNKRAKIKQWFQKYF